MPHKHPDSHRQSESARVQPAAPANLILFDDLDVDAADSETGYNNNIVGNLGRGDWSGLLGKPARTVIALSFPAGAMPSRVTAVPWKHRTGLKLDEVLLHTCWSLGLSPRPVAVTPTRGLLRFVPSSLAGYASRPPSLSKKTGW